MDNMGELVDMVPMAVDRAFPDKLVHLEVQKVYVEKEDIAH